MVLFDMSYYVVIRGPAASGKSTISKLLRGVLGGVYVSFDEVLKRYQLEVSDGRGISKESFIKANKLVAGEARLSLAGGRVVIFDGCFYHKEQLENLESALAFRHFVFDLKASVEECIRRDKGRESIGEDSIRAVHNMVSEFNYGIPTNTEGRAEAEVVAEILNIIRNGKEER